MYQGNYENELTPIQKQLNMNEEEKVEEVKKEAEKDPIE